MRTCGACRNSFPPPLRPRPRERAPDATGLDGRPGWGESLEDDAAALLEELGLEQCPHCGHVAPFADVAYPQLREAGQARASFSRLVAHAETARIYLYIAHLFGDADPREQGFWVLRAAWANEARGLGEAARCLRLRSGVLLEDALWQGFALAPERGASALLLAETFRLGGEPARALEHCGRGLRAKVSDDMRAALIVEAHAIVERSARPLTRRAVRPRLDEIAPPARGEAVRLADEAARNAPPIRKRPVRRFETTPLDVEARIFALDYLDAERTEREAAAAARSPGAPLPASSFETPRAAIRALLLRAGEGERTIAAFERLLAPFAKGPARFVASPHTERPRWTPAEEGGREARRVDLEGAITGAHLWLDPHDGSLGLELAMAQGTPADLEAALASVAPSTWRALPKPAGESFEGLTTTVDVPSPTSPSAPASLVRVHVTGEHANGALVRVVLRYLAPSTPRSLADVLTTLLAAAGPPTTVGALEAALGVALDPATAWTGALGHFASRSNGPGPIRALSAEYLWDRHHERPVHRLSALRSRSVASWTASFAGARPEIEAALLARVGPPRSIPTGHVYGLWIVSETTLARYTKLPDFAAPAPDAALRARCLAELASRATDSDLEPARRAASAFPEAAGMALRPGGRGVDLELVPPMPAVELGRAFGWEERALVGQTTGIYQTDWYLRLVIPGPQAIVPQLGPWSVEVAFDRRPTGGLAEGFSHLPLGGTYRVTETDLVRHVRIGPT